ncbi:MAG: hypothetical protein IKV98_10195 [Clostridia bacterium]|nr:hypothetical protein [Clostridia bacterium]
MSILFLKLDVFLKAFKILKNFGFVSLSPIALIEKVILHFFGMLHV